MLPLFIMTIENDDDRQFVADIYTRYHFALYRKAWKVLNDESYAEEAVHEAMVFVVGVFPVTVDTMVACVLAGHTSCP